MPASLCARLRELDKAGYKSDLAHVPPGPPWDAIRDRLHASSRRRLKGLEAGG